MYLQHVPIQSSMSRLFPFFVSRLFSSWAFSDFTKFSIVSWHNSLMDHKFQLLISSKIPENTDPSVTSNLIALASKCKKILPSLGEICSQYACTWFVPQVSVQIFLCTNWQRSTSLMYIGTLVVTLAACPYLFQLNWLSQSCTTAVCVWLCFLTSLRL